jgi:hypothetical protein
MQAVERNPFPVAGIPASSVRAPIPLSINSGNESEGLILSDDEAGEGKRAIGDNSLDSDEIAEGQALSEDSLELPPADKPDLPS